MLPADDPAAFVLDAQDRASGDALAATAFADDADGPAGCNLEAHAFDRAHEPLVAIDVHAQVAHFEERRGIVSGSQRVSHRGPPRRAVHRRES